VLIGESAGAIVTDWQGGKIFPMDIDSYEGKRWQIIAANKKVHKEILEIVSH
jgi:fructose-1,6-bisphosphatase/inositol monophosphatase family enzyme